MTKLLSAQVINQNEDCLRAPVRKETWPNRIAKQMICQFLEQLNRGSLVIHDATERLSFGQQEELKVTIHVKNHDFYRKAMTGGSLGIAESYINGDWNCDNLTNLIRIFSRNLELAGEMERGMTGILKSFSRIRHRLNANTKKQARQNISEHYDLSNDFFKLFLDPTMMYSSAWFENEQSTLEEASTEKLDRICRKLNLHPGDNVIEIGTGWGGFTEHAVKNYGCHVTTTTISKEQFEYAQKRFKKAGIQNRVNLLLEDYRDLTGQYDKLISIEMIEAVGHEYFDEFFSQCGRLLKPNGSMLIQAITLPEQRYEKYLRSVDFIQKYIFPGGCLPSMMAMSKSIANRTDLQIIHTEDFGYHYARTLNIWRERFWDRIDEVKQLGFSEKFIRMWDYYFCYCEGAFLERATGVVQLVAARPQSCLEVNHFNYRRN